jgi:diaminohydroxyphosphoribosylaminopyrimidine deaminase / 5-amino-6-(5-phosphoribosylamino)uracil reductase
MTATGHYEEAMRRALALAERGPVTGGNPQVGCVLLAPDGTVVGEGWHRGAGTPHAEVDALAKLGDKPAGVTAVVTLEPCNHTGRTGPCATALIDAGVARVVYAVSDPDPLAGGGVKHLRAAGVDVIPGVLENEVAELLRPWLIAARLGRPFVTVKWASSLDGRAAAADGSSQWITGTASRQHVHEQRARHDAIVVGTGTVLADDPALTARGDGGELLANQPVPVVIGERPVPGSAKLRSHPAGLIEIDNRDLDQALAVLFERGIRRVFVEGGPTIASAFIAAGLVDEFLLYLGPLLLGGGKLAVDDIGVASIADARTLTVTSVDRLGDDILVVARPKEGL